MCKVKRSLYGLEQVSKQWNKKLSSFHQSKHDYSLYTKSLDGHFLTLLVYVDDILLVGDYLDLIASTKTTLDAKFIIKYLGVATYFLGLQLYHLATGLYLNLQKYIHNLLFDSSF